MSSTRSDLLVQARIGTIEFAAIATSGGGDRRLARHGAIGMDGEFLEDLGEGARTDEIQAILTERQWVELDRIRRTGQVVDIVHPLFGSYMGRVASCHYQAGLRDHVEVTVVVVEDAEHKPLQIKPQSPSAAASKLTSALADLQDAYGEISDFAETVSDFADSAYSDIVDGATSIVDLVEAGIDTAADAWHAASAAYETLTDGVATIIDEIQDAADEISTDLWDSVLDVYDQAHSVAVAARETLDAITSSLASTWRQVTVQTIRPLEQNIRETVGSVTDDIIAMVLAANPDLTDPLMVPAGVVLQIPVI